MFTRPEPSKQTALPNTSIETGLLGPDYPVEILIFEKIPFDQWQKATLRSLHELRHSLGSMRLHKFEVGIDGRNRTLLSPFRSKTGRNQPSNSKFILGPLKWLRSLIEPKEGWGIAYIDWSQQEFGIAAALSGDEASLCFGRSLSGVCQAS